jgi:hypothetical protein
VLQVFPDALDDVNVILPPAQKVVGPLAATVGVTGTGLTVIVVEPLAEVHPLPFVTFTVYVPPALTVIDCVVAPVLQVFPVVLDDVKTTLPPAQNVNGPLAETVGVLGNGFTVMVVDAVEEVQPFPSVTLTV